MVGGGGVWGFGGWRDDGVVVVVVVVVVVLQKTNIRITCLRYRPLVLLCAVFMLSKSL